MAEKGFIRKNWLYRKFNSLKTALLILGLMAVTMIIGTVFPQEMSPQKYISSWGQALYERYDALGLLNIFKSTWFLALTYLFSLNIVICTYECYRSMMAKRKLQKSAKGQVFVSRGRTIEKTVLCSYDKVSENILSFIRNKNFKIEKSHITDKLTQLIVTKGISYLFLSIIFHLGIFLCVIGFIQTYLDNYEGYVSVYPGDIEEIDTAGVETRLFRTVAFFSTELKENLEYYLKGKVKLGIKRFETEYTWFNDDYYPKDWKSDVIVYDKDDNVILEKKIEVNDPIYFKGFAFYQAAYEQSCDLHITRSPGTPSVKEIKIDEENAKISDINVDEDKQTIPVKSNEPFTIEGEEGQFMIGTIRTGKLFKRFEDEPTDIVTNVDLYYFPPVEPPEEGGVPPKPKKEKTGKLVINESKNIKGMQISFDNFKEASVISYRRDAGVTVLWIASIMLMIAMCLRIYFPYYRLSIQIESAGVDSSKVIAGGNSLGLTANLQKQLDNIINAGN